MKKNILTALLIIETAILIFGVITRPAKGSEDIGQPWNSQDFIDIIMAAQVEETELLRESSPDGSYTLLVKEVGEPGFPFGVDRLEVTLFEVLPEGKACNMQYSASFMADVANDGARGAYRIEWLEDGVQVALSCKVQPTADYILTFKTLDDR